MTGQTSIKSQEFTAIRVQVETPLSFDEVLGRLRSLTGHASISEIVEVAQKARSEADYVREVKSRFVGESGFMLFMEIDHGGWIEKFGIKRRALRWILGNPLIAITMMRHDITAGLFAPVEFLATENKDGNGTTVTYVRPSSLMVVEENPPLLAAAKALDQKFDTLIAKATGAYFTGIIRDLTERKRHEEQINLLLREVNHRSKNMLSVVHAIARQTAATKPEDFIGRFGERIQALAASHDLLVKNEWKGVDLASLVRSQLAHFEDLIGKRIELQGPPVLLSATAAQTIGLALHELATNAAKYGALSNGSGRVEIAWSLEERKPGNETFVMSWREQGGPPVSVPSSQGFGSTVITRLVMESLNADVKLDFEVTGLWWRLECPSVEVAGAIA